MAAPSPAAATTSLRSAQRSRSAKCARQVSAISWFTAAIKVPTSGHYLIGNGCHLSRMKHNGVRYRVMQTANPTGWKWSVELAAGRKKTGANSTRESAILDAVLVIDKVID